MSKNITIAEGTQAKNFNNVHKIRTNLIGGGTQYWVPEDEAGDYANLSEKSINENGTYMASDDNKDGYSKVIVNVSPDLTTKQITENGTYYARNDGADGYSNVSVNVSTGGSRLITKTISKNGTYYAQNDNADGYSEVIVTGVGEVTGISSETGNEVFVEKNPSTGEIEQTELPSAIHIITYPDKIGYRDGENITITGMVVKAYKNDGTLWENTNYPGGLIPNSEITFSPTVASRDNMSGGRWRDGDNIYDIDIFVADSPIGYVPPGNGIYSGVTCTLVLNDTHRAYFTRYNGIVYATANGGSRGGVYAIPDPEDKAHVWRSSAAIYDSFLPWLSDTQSANVTAISESDPSGKSLSNMSFEAVRNKITISWNRPKDNKPLMATFDVSVSA